MLSIETKTSQECETLWALLEVLGGCKACVSFGSRSRSRSINDQKNWSAPSVFKFIVSHWPREAVYPLKYILCKNPDWWRPYDIMIGECSGLDASQATKHKSSNLQFRSVLFIMANFANLQISMLFLCNLFNEEKVLPKHYWFSNSVVPRKMHNFVAFFWWKTRFSSSRNLFGSHLSTSLFYLWNFTERNEKCIVKIIVNPLHTY